MKLLTLLVCPFLVGGKDFVISPREMRTCTLLAWGVARFPARKVSLLTSMHLGLDTLG